jgi:hypothetical protein
LTYEHASALKEDGSVLENMYAVGNSSATPIKREYIGAESTMGPALTFSYVAVDHVASKQNGDGK